MEATLIPPGTALRSGPAPARPGAGSGAVMPLKISLGHASLQGSRPRNEDYVGAATPEGAELDAKGMLLAVADGVGGHANGREAAEYAVRGLLADYYATPDTWSVETSLDNVLDAINRWLVSQSRKSPEHAGMATTLTTLVLRGTRYYVAHVGDSRAYLLREGQFSRLTEDHTWDHPELSNVLHRAVGLDSRLTVDHGDGEMQDGDCFLLVTDGVWSALPETAMAELLLRQEGAEEAAHALVREALRRGTSDNCTALVAKIASVPARNLRDSLATASRLPLPPRLRPGDEIDGLRVEELLHESRVTLLYRVTRLSAGETLVLKTLRPEAGDPEAIGALVHEEWLARRVPAPAFPQVAVNERRAHLYYLMTWHEGETLKGRLARGHRFSIPEVTETGTALLRALGTLHRLGIVHRDIKPDNLHVDRQGRLRILDLGVAASDAEDLREINNPGTPSYMAPELYAGQAASESSDLYACGVTLYELLTRKYPYGEVEPFQHPKFGDPAPPTRYRPETPAWLENLLLKACARDAKDRFETAEEFLLALERGAQRPLATRRRMPLAQRNPSLLLKVIALASLAANLVLLYLLVHG